MAVCIWSERFGQPCGGYNSSVDEQIFLAAKLIIGACEAREIMPCHRLAKAMEISEQHAELIQYILASVKFPDIAGGGDAFVYGTSPRGLFVGKMEAAKRFVAEFADYMQERWGD